MRCPFESKSVCRRTQPPKSLPCSGLTLSPHSLQHTSEHDDRHGDENLPHARTWASFGHDFQGGEGCCLLGGRGDVHVHSNTRLASRRDISFCRLEDFSLGCTFLLLDIGCRMTRILLRPTGSSTYSSCSRTGVHLWC